MHDSLVEQEAGNAQKPVIHVTGIGYADTSTATGAITVPVTVGSVAPSKGSAQGGNIITVAGTGFPVDNKSAAFSSMTVKVG